MCAAEAETPPGSGPGALHEVQASEQELAAPRRVLRTPRPGACQRIVRKHLAAALPDICTALLEHAQKGDLATLKLLWQMAELDRPAEPAAERGNDRNFVRQVLSRHRSR